MMIRYDTSVYDRVREERGKLGEIDLFDGAGD